MNPKALQKLGYGLYVVCSRNEDKFNGQNCEHPLPGLLRTACDRRGYQPAESDP